MVLLLLVIIMNYQHRLFLKLFIIEHHHALCSNNEILHILLRVVITVEKHCASCTISIIFRSGDGTTA